MQLCQVLRKPSYTFLKGWVFASWLRVHLRHFDYLGQHYWLSGTSFYASVDHSLHFLPRGSKTLSNYTSGKFVRRKIYVGVYSNAWIQTKQTNHVLQQKKLCVLNVKAQFKFHLLHEDLSTPCPNGFSSSATPLLHLFYVFQRFTLHACKFLETY